MTTKRKMFPRISDLRKVRVREVIEVERVVGEGVPEDPARCIREFYDFNGKLLARHDPGFERGG